MFSLYGQTPWPIRFLRRQTTAPELAERCTGEIVRPNPQKTQRQSVCGTRRLRSFCRTRNSGLGFFQHPEGHVLALEGKVGGRAKGSDLCKEPQPGIQRCPADRCSDFLLGSQTLTGCEESRLCSSLASGLLQPPVRRGARRRASSTSRAPA